MSGPRHEEGSRELFTLAYDNASLTADAANYFDLQVLIGATVAANWSTETGQEGALTAGEFETFSQAADPADTVGAAGAKISISFDETGTQTLPAGRTLIDCEYY